MTRLFVRCLTEFAWRSCMRARADRARRDAQALLASPHDGATAQIAEFLAFPWWEVRNLGVKLVGACSDRAHIAVLNRLVRERSDVGIVRRNAVHVTAALDETSDATAVFAAGIGDPYWEVRRESYRALAARDITPEILAEICRRMLRERSFEVKLAAARALGASGAREALAPLLALIGDRSWSVRAQGAVGLLELANALPALQPRVRAAVEHIEQTCAGVTGRVLYWERLAGIRVLLATRAWPDATTIAPFYFRPGVPWTRQ